MEKRYRFADVCVAVDSPGAEVHAMCADYRTEEEPAFHIRIGQAEIDAERSRSAQGNARQDIPVRRFSDGTYEKLAVYRAIAEKMPYYDTVLFHGSCVAVDGAAYVFAAKSGTGKSTHTRLWRELLGERAVMINDDKPLIRIGAEGATVYGTPWDGKHHLSCNTAVPLRAICLLERSAENRIEAVTAAEAYPALLQQTYRPADAAALAGTLALLRRLSGTVKLYRLGCNMEPAAAELSYACMSRSPEGAAR